MPSFQPNTYPVPGLNTPRGIYKNKPKKYMYKRKLPTSFAVPMQIASPYSRNGSSYRKRARTGGRGASYSGPYRALTLGNRHTNPVYPRPEVKYIDSTQTGAAFISATPAQTAITAAGLGGVLNKIVQNGSTPGRIGCRVSIKSVAYRFEIDLGPTPIPVSGRVVLLWDKQPNVTTTYAWTDIFSVPSYLSFMDVGNSLRFVILRNQQFSLSPQGDQSLFFEGYCKINMESVWPQGTTTAVTPQTGALVLMYISDTAVVASQPLIQGCWRVRYIDS